MTKVHVLRVESHNSSFYSSPPSARAKPISRNSSTSGGSSSSSGSSSGSNGESHTALSALPAPLTQHPRHAPPLLLGPLNTAPRRAQCHISALWVTCILALTISLVSACPILAINAVNTNNLGNALLTEVTQQQFNVLRSSVQSALDEGDYWMDFIDGWLRHIPVPLNASLLEPHLKNAMIPWMATVAKRVGGVCAFFLNDFANGIWQFCASREEWYGARRLYWEHTVNSTLMVKTRVNGQMELVEDVGSFPPYPKERPAFQWPDQYMEWGRPWIWVEKRLDGSSFTFTEIGQLRMVRSGGAVVLNRFWMQDVDWAALLISNTRFARHNSSVAMLFSTQGKLITATCGATHMNGSLIMANQSDCSVVRQMFAAFKLRGSLQLEKDFLTEHLDDGAYLLILERVVTSKGDITPYFLALAYQFRAVDEPLRRNLYTLVAVSIAVLIVVSSMACILTNHLIASPLRAVALGMYRFVELDVSPIAQCHNTHITELFSIIDSFHKMKCTLKEVAKFVPLQVIQGSLRRGEHITMSMTPANASIFFLDIANFTTLTETMEIRVLVHSIASFFGELSNIIVSHKGIIDKYIGDCIMAFWNTPLTVPGFELLTCKAALACADHMDAQPSHAVRLSARIGIEAGHVYAGMFGSEHRMNYTVVGDVVNVASRLEQLNKQCGTVILMGPQLHDAVSEDIVCRKLPDMELKGKAAKLVVYELLSLASTMPSEDCQ